MTSLRAVAGSLVFSLALCHSSAAASGAATEPDSRPRITVAPYDRDASPSPKAGTPRAGWTIVAPTPSVLLIAGQKPLRLPKGLRSEDVNLIRVQGDGDYETAWPPGQQVRALDAATLRSLDKRAPGFRGFKRHKIYLVRVGARVNGGFTEVSGMSLEVR